MDVSLIVVNYHTPGHLRRLLESIEQFHPSELQTEVILIDVETFFNPVLGVDKYHSFTENIGFARACNYGATLAEGDVLGFLNADTCFINDSCLPYCVNFLRNRSDVGAVGPMQVDRRGNVTHAGFTGTQERMRARGWKSQESRKFAVDEEVISVSGSAYFTRKSVWDEMTACPLYQKAGPAEGGFLPTPHYFEETYYSYHLRGHGYKVFYLGKAKMIHEWHQSSKVGSQRDNYKLSQALFNKACDIHGLAHE